MKNYSLLTAIALLAITSSCRNENTSTKVPLSDDVKTRQRYDQIKEFAWLEGEWQNNTPDGLFTEKWTKETDSTFTGHSVIIKDKDTVFYETIILDQKGDSLHYIVTNPKQTTADKTVSFTLKSFTADSYNFENKQHDFPQRITYTKVNNDSILCKISGLLKGKPAQEEFPMHRKK